VQHHSIRWTKDRSGSTTEQSCQEAGSIIESLNDCSSRILCRLVDTTLTCQTSKASASRGYVVRTSKRIVDWHIRHWFSYPFTQELPLREKWIPKSPCNSNNNHRFSWEIHSRIHSINPFCCKMNWRWFVERDAKRCVPFWNRTIALPS
jgi:hypothetical protein